MFHLIFNLQFEDCFALHFRVCFTRLFYQSLCSLNRRETQNQNQNQTGSVSGSGGIGECQKLLTKCAELIPSLLKTIDRGIQPIENTCKPIDLNSIVKFNGILCIMMSFVVFMTDIQIINISL